jgi:small-conductance mechanosensitive channel
VERISLSYTSLVTDEGRKIFVPNETMIENVIVNHSRGDRRRAVSVRLPISIDAPIDDACRIARASAEAVQGDTELEIDINVVDVTETAIWLEIAGFAPARLNLPQIATEIRTGAVTALAKEGLLPVHERVAETTH